MKKSKVLVPALGILCLSTAAAVTGTVAWFTASRLQTVSMENITLVNPESGLSAKITDGKACTLDQANMKVTHALVGTDQGYLRDGSVDLAAEKVYKAVVNDNGAIASFAEQAIGTADTKAYNGHSVYHATRFTMTFSALNNDPTNVDNCLFFSPNLSSATKAGDVTDKAYNALRIGMKAGSEWFVWAPFYAATLSDNTTANKFAYVNGTATTNVQDLNDTNGIKNNDTVAEGGVESALDDSNGALTADARDLTYYLGVLPPDAETGLAVNIYTWFEGTDGYCVEDFWSKVQGGVSASLSFVSRNVAK